MARPEKMAASDEPVAPPPPPAWSALVRLAWGAPGSAGTTYEPGDALPDAFDPAVEGLVEGVHVARR